jgi:parallel beta helix pectate lyase-like protein/K319-like protein
MYPARYVVRAICLVFFLDSGWLHAKEIPVSREEDESWRIGTLRNAIQDLAEAGDTIVFERHVKKIELSEEIVIPPRLGNLSITSQRKNGPVLYPQRNINTPFVVQANNTTIQGLTFSDVQLDIYPVNGIGTLQGVHIVNNRFQRESYIHIQNTNDCEVKGNKLNVEDYPGPGGSIGTLFTERCVISDNEVTTTGGFGILELESKEITVHKNTVKGGWLYVATESGSVINNTVLGKDGIFIDHAVPDNHLLVSGNTAPWMTVERANVSIIDNDLTLPKGFRRRIVLRVDNSSPTGARGPVIIRDNDLVGGRVGLTYSGSGEDAGAGSIIYNTISGCLDMGMRIGSADRLVVDDNEISRCGRGDQGSGMIVAGPLYHDVRITNNRIHHIKGTGLKVRPAVPGGALLVNANQINKNKVYGIEVFPDPAAEADDSEAELEGDPESRATESANSEEDKDALVEEVSDPTIQGGRILFDNNTISRNTLAGVMSLPRSKAAFIRGSVNNNGEAGIYVDTDAIISITQVSFENNRGPGIDITPLGVTLNDDQKMANRDLDWPADLRLDPVRRKLIGDAGPGATIDIYQAESVPRRGNPNNGEGNLFLGRVTADANGIFKFPAEGQLECFPEMELTSTATDALTPAASSEFSPNLDCIFPDPTAVDTDRDGVVDSQDLCPDSPRGTTVNSSGCPEPPPQNRPPQADAGADQSGTVAAPIVLDGSGSSDPDGDPISFLWTFLGVPAGSAADISNATSESAGFTPDVPGQYSIRLQVSDAWVSDTTDILINIEDTNTPPIAAIAALENGAVGELVTLDGSLSFDDDGDLLTYDWEVVAAPVDSTVSVVDSDAIIASITPDVAGSYTLKLTVSDDAASGEATTLLKAGLKVTLSFAEVLVFDPDQFQFADDSSSGSCTNCVVLFNDGYLKDCASSSSLAFISAPNTFSGQGCSAISTPVSRLDCSDSQCWHENDFGTRCDGPPGGCQLDVGGTEITACREEPEARDCEVLYDNLTGYAPISIEGDVTSVSKYSEDGSGTFEFTASGRWWASGAQSSSMSITTDEDGHGDKQWQIVYSDAQENTPIRITESEHPLWTTSSECTGVRDPYFDVIQGTTSLEVPANRSWNCVFTNSKLVDSDGDGIPDKDDNCPEHPGTDGAQCPEEHDDGLLHLFCKDPLRCDLTNGLGSCAACTMVRLGDDTSVSCAGSALCSSQDETLRIQGGGDYQTPGISGSCGEGASCTLGDDFSCTSAEDGSGCQVDTAGGESFECEIGVRCELRALPGVFNGGPGSAYSVEIAKRTVNGNDLFRFDWLSPPSSGARFEGVISILTAGDEVGGEGTTVHEFILRESVPISVQEIEDSNSWALTGIECLRPEFAEVDLSINEVIVSGTNRCTFINQKTVSEPPTIRPLDATPEGVTNSNTFGLPPGNRVVIGTQTGVLVVDALTGEVPVVGNNQRLSFLDDDLPSIGALILKNSQVQDQDIIYSIGSPNAVSRFLDPVSGFFSFAQLGPAGYTDQVHMGGDVDATEMLYVDNTLNRISARLPDNGAGFWQTTQVTTNNSFGLASGNVVTAFAEQLGNLQCRDPCEINGLPMPSGCTADIDATVQANPSCADIWGSSCVSQYSALTESSCSLPASQRVVNFGGMVIAVTDGQPGQVHLVTPRAPFQANADLLGATGNDPRRIRCAQGICAVSNFGSASLTLLTWDGLTNASVVGEVLVGDGPVGIDIKAQGENAAIISTGFNDNTYTVTIVAPDGSVVANDSSPIPDGCINPGHAIWLNNTEKVVATCTGSNSYAVFEP